MAVEDSPAVARGPVKPDSRPALERWGSCHLSLTDEETEAWRALAQQIKGDPGCVVGVSIALLGVLRPQCSWSCALVWTKGLQ